MVVVKLSAVNMGLIVARFVMWALRQVSCLVLACHCAFARAFVFGEVCASGSLSDEFVTVFYLYLVDIFSY